MWLNEMKDKTITMKRGVMTSIATTASALTFMYFTATTFRHVTGPQGYIIFNLIYYKVFSALEVHFT